MEALQKGLDLPMKHSAAQFDESPIREVNCIIMDRISYRYGRRDEKVFEGFHARYTKG